MPKRRLEAEPLRGIARTLDAVINEIDMAISATPSGERRNELCDANIHVRAALGLIVDGSDGSERYGVGDKGQEATTRRRHGDRPHRTRTQDDQTQQLAKEIPKAVRTRT